MRPVIREHVSILDMDSSDVRFFCSHRRQMFHFSIDDAGRRALAAADGRRSVDEIMKQVGARHLKRSDVAEFFGSLIESGMFRDTSRDVRVEFDRDYETRMRRQIIYLSGLAPAGHTGHDLQDRLKRSRILVIGAGGAGSHLAVQLAGIGVGRLVVVDHDRIELGNIGRQIHYAGHLGERKVDVIADVLRTISPQTQVTTLAEKLTPTSGWVKELASQADLVLNCADHPSTDLTSRWLFETCYPLRIPLIPAGGYNGHMTSVPPTLLPGKSTCWPCYEKATARKNSPYTGELNLSQIKSGIFLPATVAMAALQMPEIVRVLTGHEAPKFINQRGEFDLSTCALTVEKVPPTPGCRMCEGRD